MAGRAPFSGEEAVVIERCRLLNGADEWEPAQNPLNRYSTIRKDLSMQKMNPGYMFSKTMLDANPTASIGLVVDARGNTRIEEWAKGTSYYNEAVRRVKKAQQSGVLRGVLWHQGEANATDRQYLRKLQTLIADLRADLGEPNLPFVAGEINNIPLVNNQLKQLPVSVPFTGVASAEGLVAMDKWHFDNSSMKLLGQRYASEMMRIQRESR